MKKKLFLLPLVAGLFLSGCKFSLFGKTIYLFEKKPDEQTDIDDVIPEDTNKHADAIALNPGNAFYLRVGETRQLTISFKAGGQDMNPTQDSEKIFVWSYSGDKISFSVTGTEQEGSSVEGGTKATVTGVKAGTALLNVKNTYNQSLTRDFTIRVIDFDDDDYLWQYDKSDKVQFGYDSKYAKNGIKEGDATLNGLTWHFVRSSVISLNTSLTGAIGFGASSRPETKFTLSTSSERVVESIAIEAASANGLAKMNVKVNDVSYISDASIPDKNGTSVESIATSSIGTEKGLIVIEIKTPSQAGEDTQYREPGAFYIRSIMVCFEESDPPVTIQTFNFKEMYDDSDDTILHNLGTDPKTVSFNQNDFDVTFERARKENDAIPGYAITNGYIEVKLNKENEIISNVELKIKIGSSKNYYTLNTSKSGGAPFNAGTIKTDDDGLLKIRINEDNINALRFTRQNQNNVGLEYLIIKTRTGVNPTIKEISVPEEFEPTKKNYKEGEEFDPTGLSALTIVYNQENLEPDPLPIDYIEWFDGPSFDNDPTTATKILSEGTTYVYGVFRGQQIVKIEGLTTVDVPISLTLVKNISEIDSSSHYYLVAKDKKGLIKGSAGSNMGQGSETKGGVCFLTDTLGDNLTISGSLGNDYFTLEENEDKYSIKSTLDYFFGMTSGGGLSTTQNPEGKGGTRYFDLTIDGESGLCIMHYEILGENTKTGYLTFGNTNVGMNPTEISKFVLYKAV